MATVADLTEINAAVDTIITDGGILHQVIHGAVGDPPITVESGQVNNLATALSLIMGGGLTTDAVRTLIADALHIEAINSLVLDDDTGILSINYIDENGSNDKSVDLSVFQNDDVTHAIVMDDLNSTDLNTVITPGWYRVIAGNSNFPPDGQRGALRVVSTGTDALFRQDYYESDIAEPHHYTRSTLNAGASWSPWKQALHTLTIGTANQVLTSTGSGYGWADPGPGTTYSAGSGLDLEGTQFSLEEASDTNVGGIELATDAEAADGTDNRRAITPAVLKSVTDALPEVITYTPGEAIDIAGGVISVESASTSNRGSVQLASNIQTQFGVITVRAVTPAGLKSVIEQLLLVPEGGTALQVLTKGSGDTFSWQDASGGGGGLTQQEVQVLIAAAGHANNLTASYSTSTGQLTLTLTLDDNTVRTENVLIPRYGVSGTGIALTGNIFSLVGATENSAGAVFLATEAHVLEGTNASDAVTSATLQAKINALPFIAYTEGDGINIINGVISGEQANTNNRGVVQLANNPTTISGTSNSTAVTPSGLNSVIDLIRQVPTGGTALQVLTKGSESTFSWQDAPSSGGGGLTQDQVQVLIAAAGHANNLTASYSTSTGQLTLTLSLDDNTSRIENVLIPRYLAGVGLDLNSQTFSLESATTSSVGGVELATNAETNTGTDATKAVTPAALKSVTDALPTGTTYTEGAGININGTEISAEIATEINSGSVELANNAETATGTDFGKAVTPKGLKSVTDQIKEVPDGGTENQIIIKGSGDTYDWGDAAAGSGGGGSSAVRVTHLDTTNTTAWSNVETTRREFTLTTPLSNDSGKLLFRGKKGSTIYWEAELDNQGFYGRAASDTRAATLKIASSTSISGFGHTTVYTYRTSSDSTIKFSSRHGANIMPSDSELEIIFIPDGGSGSGDGSGTTYTEGDGININGTVISAETATTSNVGGVELATNAETNTGTDATKAVTPAALKSVTDALPTGTTYSAGEGIDLNGTIISVEAASTLNRGSVFIATPNNTRDGDNATLAVSPVGLKAVLDELKEVPDGGTEDQVLTKGSGDTYAWGDAASGGGFATEDLFEGAVDVASAREWIGTGYTVPADERTGYWLINFGESSTATNESGAWVWVDVEQLFAKVAGVSGEASDAATQLLFQASLGAGNTAELGHTTTGEILFTTSNASADALPLTIRKVVAGSGGGGSTELYNFYILHDSSEDARAGTFPETEITNSFHAFMNFTQSADGQIISPLNAALAPTVQATGGQFVFENIENITSDGSVVLHSGVPVSIKSSGGIHLNVTDPGTGEAFAQIARIVLLNGVEISRETTGTYQVRANSVYVPFDHLSYSYIPPEDQPYNGSRVQFVLDLTNQHNINIGTTAISYWVAPGTRETITQLNPRVSGGSGSSETTSTASTYTELTGDLDMDDIVTPGEYTYTRGTSTLTNGPRTGINDFGFEVIPAGDGDVRQWVITTDLSIATYERSRRNGDWLGWRAVQYVPSGGTSTDGQVLTKTGPDSDDYGWEDLPTADATPTTHPQLGEATVSQVDDTFVAANRLDPTTAITSLNDNDEVVFVFTTNDDQTAEAHNSSELRMNVARLIEMAEEGTDITTNTVFSSDTDALCGSINHYSNSNTIGTIRILVHPGRATLDDPISFWFAVNNPTTVAAPINVKAHVVPLGSIGSGNAIAYTEGAGINISGTVVSAETATTTNLGSVELANNAETSSGTNSTDAVTPASLKAHLDTLLAGVFRIDTIGSAHANVTQGLTWVGTGINIPDTDDYRNVNWRVNFGTDASGKRSAIQYVIDASLLFVVSTSTAAASVTDANSIIFPDAVGVGSDAYIGITSSGEILYSSNTLSADALPLRLQREAAILG